MNQLDQLKIRYPNYIFIADPTMPPGLRALNINEIIYFNPNLPHTAILPLLTAELDHWHGSNLVPLK